MTEGAPQPTPRQEQKLPAKPLAERTPEKLPEVTDDEAIKGIDFILDQHEEFRAAWEKMIEALPLQEQLVKLEDLAAKRREILAPKVYISEKLEVLKDETPFTEALFNHVIDMVERDSEEIGRGHNGRIIEYRGEDKQTESNVVYKVLIRAPTAQQNDLLSEASYLADMYALSEKYEARDVGVPKPYYVATLTNARILSMEKLPGLSLEKIMESNIEIPPEVSLDEIEEKLLKFVNHLNQAGFYHNDIRPGNIMLDLERKNPNVPEVYLIDTGNAKYEYAKQDNLDNPTDRVMLKQVLQSLKNYKERQPGKNSV
jgi:tRNA A-37 threonylcarbamoyl transferase component Bud32